MRIRTLREFSGVPAGTEGEAERERDGKFRITWDLSNRAKPLIDWFDEQEVSLYLEVIKVDPR